MPARPGTSILWETRADFLVSFTWGNLDGKQEELDTGEGMRKTGARAHLPQHRTMNGTLWPADRTTPKAAPLLHTSQHGFPATLRDLKILQHT